MSIKTKLAVMNFLEFAIWGTYLTCIGNYLGANGLGGDISLFYAIQGVVSIFMPAIMGILADKYIEPQRLLGLCHLAAAIFMGLAWYYGYTHPDAIEFGPIFTLYTLSVAFFMPTIALANTVAFSSLKRNGLDTVTDFPPIRVLGTVGFIAAMWFVNGFYIYDGQWGYMLSNPLGDTSPFDPRFQYTVNQLAVCSIIGLCLALYCFMMPRCPLIVVHDPMVKKPSVAESLGLDAFKLFRSPRMAIFFIFSMLLGVSLQITNGYATPFITSFKAMPEFLDSFAANNATLLTSLSQISEACCILLIPFCLRRFGIKNVMLIAMGAWVLRFGFFGIGSPGMPGVILFIISMLVYGVAFDFFNVSGALYVEKETDPKMQASAQGLFMLMTNGVGATLGMLAAGAVVNTFCHYEGEYMVGDWTTTWLIFASYAAMVMVLFLIIFRNPSKKKSDLTLSEVRGDQGSGDGFVVDNLPK
ncbi:MAG: MFS transporter [Muribaculaceae bacterium]|nr:MFS transporter [Muribaculaceae bacterium]